MISLAPLKYRAILGNQGGPLARLDYGSGEGNSGYHATAELRDDLFPSTYRRGRSSCGAPDGAGTHSIKQIACHMAISEAIERWALHHLRANKVNDRYGLDLDPSSNGFAAFPGLTARPARNRARAEAIERHCLLCWWEGLLEHHPLPDPAPGVKAIRLENPFSRHAVTVIWGIHRGLHYIYGFGAGKDATEACRRSLIERERCGVIIDQHLEGRRNESLRDRDIAGILDPFERRILHFSRPQGFRLFHQRLQHVAAKTAPKAETYFNGPVPGLWSRYATVWRTVMVPPTQQHLTETVDYFFW